MEILRSPREIAQIRKAGLLVWEAIRLASLIIRPGVTTEELDAAIETFFAQHQVFPSYKGVSGTVPFPAVSCICVNEEAANGVPGPRELCEGDIVSINPGCKLSGWCASAAATFPVGRIDPEKQRLLDVTKRTLAVAIEAMGRRRRWSEVAPEMEACVKQAGFSVVEAFVGHGIGREQHEDPQVPSFVSSQLRRGTGDFRLVPGLVFAVHSIVNTGTKRVRVKADHWTQVTADGLPSAEFKHTIAMTESGPEILTAGPNGELWMDIAWPDGDGAGKASYRDRLSEARELLAKGDYLASRRRMAELLQRFPMQSDQLRSEFGFIFDFAVDEGVDQRNWEQKHAQIEWRRKVWAILCENGDNDLLSTFIGESQEAAEVQQAEEKAPGLPRALLTPLTPEAQGEALERASLELLRLLFRSEEGDDEPILDELAQQRRGTQLGFDIKATYCAPPNVRVRCLIECKSQNRNITPDDIGGKLHEAEAFQSDIDHWILIAPCAGISNTLRALLDQWEKLRRYPFQIQLWTKDTEVGQLFGLIPSLYDAWCSNQPTEEEHPSQWSQVKRERILKHWCEKLRPPIRLPKGWDVYVQDPRSLRVFSDESQRVLDQLVASSIEPAGLDETGAPFPEPLAQTVLKWLQSPKRVLLLLGDFGDGKTAFTYLFSHRILRTFRSNPKDGWIPVRFSLRDFSRPGVADGRDLLRRRLEEFGADLTSWISLLRSHNVVVILDGMDEMSRAMDVETINRMLDRLVDCCTEEFKDRKILLTCRTAFFRSLAARDYLLDRLEAPMIVRLRSFDRVDVTKKLAAMATTLQQETRLQILRMMHDPIGLATKALFYRMISETLWDPQAHWTSEVGLYSEYVRKCLEHKGDSLEMDGVRLTRPHLIENMSRILEVIAWDIHSGGKEYACLKQLANKKGATDYARLLWDAVDDISAEQDAISRVGVRSLLRRVELGDDPAADQWPVDFCHRSMREYFVARRIEAIVRESVSRAREVLSRTDLSHEIVAFASSLMRHNESVGDCGMILRQLATDSRLVGENSGLTPDQRRRLGRNSVTLLYRAQGHLHERAWNNMLLDGADLSGADLTGKNFSGTSLRYANLDNVVFTDADFTNVDLTGVRLEETAEVRSISVPPNGEGFMASYSDGGVRRWTFASAHDVQSQITFEAIPKSGERIEAVALPGGALCLLCEKDVIFADQADHRHKQVAAFKTKPGIARVLLKESRVLVVEEKSRSCYVAWLFALAADEQPRRIAKASNASWLCDTLGDCAILRVETDGRVVVVPFDNQGDFQVVLEDVEKASAVAVWSPRHDEGDKYLIACGEQNGSVGVWECQLTDQTPCVRRIVRLRVHECAVGAVAFLGRHALLSGGNDRRICYLGLGNGEPEETSIRTFELRLRCEGMKIDGLKSDKERAAIQWVQQAH